MVFLPRFVTRRAPQRQRPSVAPISLSNHRERQTVCQVDLSALTVLPYSPGPFGCTSWEVLTISNNRRLPIWETASAQEPQWLSTGGNCSRSPPRTKCGFLHGGPGSILISIFLLNFIFPLSRFLSRMHSGVVKHWRFSRCQTTSKASIDLLY